jgi:hypothetical protein
VAQPPSGQWFNSVQGEWNEPSIAGVCNASTRAEGQWVGLGGVTSGDLAQIGTEYGVPYHAHQGWYLVLPDMGDTVWIQNFTPNVGDTILAQVQYSQSSGTFYFWMEDYTTGWYTNPQPTYTSASWDGSSGDFIVERPTYIDPNTLKVTIPPLADFGSVYWSQAVVNGSRVGTFPNNYNVWIYSNGAPSTHLLADTDATLTNNQNFTDRWHNCT